MARVDYERMAGDYERGRGLPLDAIDAWREALSPYLPPDGGLPLLDVGAGTGTFAGTIARWFDVPVVALEPAEGMRREARRLHSHPRVDWIAARGEDIPLRDGSCGAAWLSTVIHHLTNPAACARELRRVLRPGGPVLIRSSFPGRHHHITLFRFFPGARRVAETFPTVEETAAAFAAAGFRLESLQSVPQVSAPSLAVFRDRVRLRADSTLAPLSDQEFDRGMDALDRAVRHEAVPSPVVDRLDLMVLR